MSRLRTLWRKLRTGAPLSDSEVDDMIIQVECALDYLRDGGPRYSLVYLDSYRNLQTLKGFKEERGRK